MYIYFSPTSSDILNVSWFTKRKDVEVWSYLVTDKYSNKLKVFFSEGNFKSKWPVWTCLVDHKWVFFSGSKSETVCRMKWRGRFWDSRFWLVNAQVVVWIISCPPIIASHFVFINDVTNIVVFLLANLFIWTRCTCLFERNTKWTKQQIWGYYFIHFKRIFSLLYTWF